MTSLCYFVNSLEIICVFCCCWIVIRTRNSVQLLVAVHSSRQKLLLQVWWSINPFCWRPSSNSFSCSLTFCVRACCFIQLLLRILWHTLSAILSIDFDNHTVSLQELGLLLTVCVFPHFAFMSLPIGHLHVILVFQFRFKRACFGNCWDCLLVEVERLTHISEVEVDRVTSKHLMDHHVILSFNPSNSRLALCRLCSVKFYRITFTDWFSRLHRFVISSSRAASTINCSLSIQVWVTLY